jgi:hypothetical protein
MVVIVITSMDKKQLVKDLSQVEVNMFHVRLLKPIASVQQY